MYEILYATQPQTPRTNTHMDSDIHMHTHTLTPHTATHTTPRILWHCNPLQMTDVPPGFDADNGTT